MDGQRLDKMLALRQDGLSRTRIRILIEQGDVLLMRATQNHTQSHTIKDPSFRVKQDDEIIMALPPVQTADIKPQNIPLHVLYEDDSLIVINKPAGLVVHPAAGNPDGTLVNALMAHCGDSLSGIGGQKRPGIVHRLDKDTSGVMVAAKSDTAHNKLAKQFAAHGADGRLQRAYETFVWGCPHPAAGRIDAPLARHPRHRQKMHVTQHKSARNAATRYTKLADWGDPPLISQLRCELETGRTHQIRVHLANLGHPVIGDSLYGAGHAARLNKCPPPVAAAIAALGRQALHAALLGFEHPKTGEKMQFSAPFPDDIAGLHASLKEV